MNWEVLKPLAVIFLVGSIGGFIGGLLDKPPKSEISKYRILPYFQKCGTVFPGLLLSTFLGGFAACIWWALYNSFSNVIVTGSIEQIQNQSHPYVTLGQLATSFLTGMVGITYLITEAGRRCLKGN